MKYFIGLLLAFLLIGCSAQPVDDPSDEIVADTPSEEEIASDQEPISQEQTETTIEEPEIEDQPIPEENFDISELTEVEQAHVESMIQACKGGNLGLCKALETRYGIVVDRETSEGIEDDSGQTGVEDDSGVEGTQEDI